MIKITTKIERKGNSKEAFDKIVKALTTGPKGVKVGLPTGKTPSSIVAYAFYNHEGTNRAKGDVFFRGGQFGISGPIPPRPFITQAMFKGRREIQQKMRNGARDILHGTKTMEGVLMQVGILGQGLIQKHISAGVGPPNSPMTIKLKKSSKPLIDDGTMRDSITWEIEK